MAVVKKWDEEMNMAAAKQCDEMTTTNEEANMNAVGHREMQGAINLLSFRTDAAATATEKRMNLGGSLEVRMSPESTQRRMVIETRPVREIDREWEERTKCSFGEGEMSRFQATPLQGVGATKELNTLQGEMGEVTEEDRSDGWVERERRGDWSHLFGPECCSVCGQNPFECGCLNVSFARRWEKKRREEREREREMEKMGGLVQVDHLKELRRKWEMSGLGGMGHGGLRQHRG